MSKISYKNISYENIKGILDDKFIETEQMAKTLTLAMLTNKNCLIWGEGGYAKSTMVEEVVEKLGLKNETFVQSFGEGMDESRLWGGLDYQKLDQDRVLEYHPERSFLNFKIAVFEELFDAPPIVLLALKDALTARELRNGMQRFPMKTKTIIAITNRNPQEISDISSAAHALVERFPLQINIKWHQQDNSMYNRLFRKVKPRVKKEVRGRLAFIIDKALNNAAIISPRTAVHALEIVDKAMSSGFSERESYQSLSLIPGFEPILDDIDTELQEAEDRREAQDKLDENKEQLEEIKDQLSNAHTPLSCLQLAKELMLMKDDVHDIRVPDQLVEQKQNIQNEIQTLIQTTQEKSITLTQPREIEDKSPENEELDNGEEDASEEPSEG